MVAGNTEGRLVAGGIIGIPGGQRRRSGTEMAAGVPLTYRHIRWWAAADGTKRWHPQMEEKKAAEDSRRTWHTRITLKVEGSFAVVISRGFVLVTDRGHRLSLSSAN